MTAGALPRIGATALRQYARGLFQAAGAPADKASVMADILVAADLLGHDTHGLALAPRYLDAMIDGSMHLHGEPVVINDRGACVTWDGKRLPGVWLVAAGLDLTIDRARQWGCATLVIRHSHHIGCLAAYLERATSQSMMVIISSSDPSQSTVAPFGGRQGVFTPNPVAAGIPTGVDPILIDSSASITTNNMAARRAKAGQRYPSACLLDADGHPTDDPAVLSKGGTLMPAGGLDHGQKGYGWALLVEAWTQALSGHGRADASAGWGASVFIQVMDPDAFAGTPAFIRQTDWLAQACRQSSPRPGVDRVRLPGESGLRRRDEYARTGIPMPPALLTSLRSWAERLAVPVPDGIPADA